MAVVVPGRFIYLHVPKTGGKWMKLVLDRNFPGAKRITSTTHGNTWARYGHPDLLDVANRREFRFAFVRHPVDWWRSLWRHYARRGWNMKLELDRTLRDDDFDTFIAHALERLPGYASRMFSRFVGEPGSEIDFIGRQENLEADLRRALELAGVDVSGLDLTIPRANEGGANTAHLQFSAAQRKALTLAEREGMERFGYDGAPWL
jgi:hypothetical protein